MKKIKETRIINRSELASLLCRRGWYDKADINDHLLKMIDVSITSELFYLIAEDILNHSTIQCSINTIMFELSLICYSEFVIENL